MRRGTSRLDLFRYGIIMPLLTGEESNVRKFCHEVSGKPYYYKGKEYYFSEETIRKWYYKYLNEGFDNLSRKTRSDKNTSRKISEEGINYIVDLKSGYPRMTTKKIYERLKEDRMVKEDVSINSFYRYMKTNNLKTRIIANKERRRYEKEYPNDTWQADTSYGPYIKIDGKKYRTYLIQFIDDNSRLVVGYGFYFHDNAVNVQKTFKKAIEKYGVPKQIYLDNGKPYSNEQIEIICARLGIKLTHTHAYDPAAKGKVERCFKTIKEGWMYARDWNKYISIKELEEDYGRYLYDEYINKEHSELGDTPNNVWHKGIENTLYKQIEKEQLEEYFMNTVKRVVTKDRLVSINNKYYEVPYKYVGCKIELRYYTSNEEELWVYENNERKEKCEPLNKKDNSKVKRENNIDYSKLVNNEEDVIECS